MRICQGRPSWPVWDLVSGVLVGVVGRGGGGGWAVFGVGGPRNRGDVFVAYDDLTHSFDLWERKGHDDEDGARIDRWNWRELPTAPTPSKT